MWVARSFASLSSVNPAALRAYYATWVSPAAKKGQAATLSVNDQKLLVAWHTQACGMRKTLAHFNTTGHDWKEVTVTNGSVKHTLAYASFLGGQFQDPGQVGTVAALLAPYDASVDLVFADVNYGLKEGAAWDVKWTQDDFESSIVFAEELSNGDLTAVKFAWFLADYQMNDWNTVGKKRYVFVPPPAGPADSAGP